MAMASSPYLLRSAYVDSRNIQDQQINTELRIIRTDLGEVGQKVGRLEQKVDRLEQKVDKLEQDVQEVKEVLRENTIEQRRSTAWFRNQLLKNPTLPIQPIVVHHPTMGIVVPNSNLFPKHAKEFYSLREPKSARLQGKLQYLLSFYDVALPETKSTISTKKIPSDDDDDDTDDTDDNDDDDAESFQDNNHRAVYLLEGILGLSEDNFDSFVERARERARQAQEQPPPRASKRQQRTAPTNEPIPYRPYQGGGGSSRPVLTVSDIIRGEQPSPPGKSAGSYVSIGWKEGSSPSQQQQQQQQLQGEQQQTKPSSTVKTPSEHSDSGSSTNPNTKSPSSDRLRGRR